MTNPVAYFHCKMCIGQNLKSNIAAGATADGNLVVWCENHQTQVGVFTMKTPFDLSKIACAACGEPFDGRRHVH